VQFTGRATQHIGAKLGFKTVIERDYATFEFEGTRPFATITSSPGVHFGVKSLQ
jgi:hypothetical protein